MKIAIVCDALVQHGGHEHIILEFCKMYPGAPLYTTAATKKWKKICKDNDIELRTSFLQKFPFIKKLNRVYAPFLLYILALESFNFDEFDVVVSLSSRFAQGVITKPKTLHICYMSTVGRMFWEPHAYFKYESFGLFRKLVKTFLKLPLSYIRMWDRTAAQRPDVFITISKTTQDRIKKYYNREASIIYPPIKLNKFKTRVSKLPNDFFIVVTRLAPWKRVDIAIKACIAANVKLKIIGEGPDRKRLERLVGDSKFIEFLGYVSEEEKIKYLQNCLALIMTQFEDFGLVPLEAMACGKPTIAYAKGGVLETVVPGETGEFYYKQNEQSLEKVLLKFDSGKYKKETCTAQAAKFDLPIFTKNMKGFIAGKHRSHRAD